MTAVVGLRRVAVSDAEMIHAWRSEPSASRYQPLRPSSVPALRELLARRSSQAITPDLTGEAQWLIVAEGEPVGWITLEILSREHGIGSIGYTVAEAHRGRGYAGAGVRALLPLALAPDRADLFRLEAVAAVENIASRRVLAAAGFSEEGVARAYLVVGGVRRDHVRVALLRSEWLAQGQG